MTVMTLTFAGCIRVYCRVRPFLPGQANVHSTVDYIGENGNIIIVNPRKQGKDARRIFSFNKVFGTNASQGMFTFQKYSLYKESSYNFFLILQSDLG